MLAIPILLHDICTGRQPSNLFVFCHLSIISPTFVLYKFILKSTPPPHQILYKTHPRQQQKTIPVITVRLSYWKIIPNRHSNIFASCERRQVRWKYGDFFPFPYVPHSFLRCVKKKIVYGLGKGERVKWANKTFWWIDAPPRTQTTTWLLMVCWCWVSTKMHRPRYNNQKNIYSRSNNSNTGEKLSDIFLVATSADARHAPRMSSVVYNERKTHVTQNPPTE